MRPISEPAQRLQRQEANTIGEIRNTLKKLEEKHSKDSPEDVDSGIAALPYARSNGPHIKKPARGKSAIGGIIDERQCSLLQENFLPRNKEAHSTSAKPRPASPICKKGRQRR